MIKWDWYQTTIDGSDPEKMGLVDLLLQAWDLSDWRSARNLNGYHFGGAIMRGDEVLCHLCWGGQPGINLKSTSSQSGTLAKVLKNNGIAHRPTRLDACRDWDVKGLFDGYAKYMIGFAKEHKITIDQRGDWERGKARTLYLGSEKSAVRICMYEKGYEQGGGASLDWCRLEVRVRPKPSHREKIATWEPKQVFEAGWVRSLLLGLQHTVGRYESVATIWEPSDEEKLIRSMLRQYGRCLKIMAQKHDGDWQKVGQEIGNLLEEN